MVVPFIVCLLLAWLTSCWWSICALNEGGWHSVGPDVGGGVQVCRLVLVCHIVSLSLFTAHFWWWSLVNSTLAALPSNPNVVALLVRIFCYYVVCEEESLPAYDDDVVLRRPLLDRPR